MTVHHQVTLLKYDLLGRLDHDELIPICADVLHMVAFPDHGQRNDVGDCVLALPNISVILSVPNFVLRRVQALQWMLMLLPAL
jgi:hypothetical protein